jgi:hypothetical protein
MSLNAARSGHSASSEAPKYKRWQDVPDSLIPKTSKRDPENPIYSHPRYINYRKKQIFYQQEDGIPVYLKNGPTDYILYYGLWIVSASIFVYSFSWIVQNQFYPKKKAE